MKSIKEPMQNDENRTVWDLYDRHSLSRQETEAFTQPEYWVSHVAQAVRFYDAMKSASAVHLFTIFIPFSAWKSSAPPLISPRKGYSDGFSFFLRFGGDRCRRLPGSGPRGHVGEDGQALRGGQGLKGLALVALHGAR